MFCIWGVSGCPCLYTPYICMPPRGVHPHISPILLCASVCSHRLLHVVGGCKGSPYMLDTSFTPPPVWRYLPLCFNPHSFVGFPVHWYVLEISVCHMGIFPLCWGLGGVPPSVGSLGASAHGVSICLFLYILVVCYVLHFYYSYDYYSSSYGGVFWAVIYFISDHGFFPDGASCNTGSVWSGSTTTLGTKRLWRCYWPCLCATAATSHLQCLFWLMPIMLWVLHR